MNLYLVRHGKAEDGADDRARRLTDRGRQAVERVARRLRKADVHVGRIEHSGLVRAEETAEILARAVGGELFAVDDLHPSDDVAATASRLRNGARGDLMLVGHQPYMGRLASNLLVGDADADLLHFVTGAVVCLSDDEGGWALEWLLTPGIA